MTSGRTFTSRPAYYRRNYEMGASLRVVPAVLGTDTGSSTPGAAIFMGHSHLLAVITAEHGWKLADALSNTLDGQGAA